MEDGHEGDRLGLTVGLVSHRKLRREFSSGVSFHSATVPPHSPLIAGSRKKDGLGLGLYWKECQETGQERGHGNQLQDFIRYGEDRFLQGVEKEKLLSSFSFFSVVTRNL